MEKFILQLLVPGENWPASRGRTPQGLPKGRIYSMASHWIFVRYPTYFYAAFRRPHAWKTEGHEPKSRYQAKRDRELKNLFPEKSARSPG
jgi:hypothetical protein